MARQIFDKKFAVYSLYRPCDGTVVTRLLERPASEGNFREVKNSYDRKSYTMLNIKPFGSDRVGARKYQLKIERGQAKPWAARA